MNAILLRDLRSYAATMTGWVFVAFILVFMGIFTMTYNLTGGYGNFEYVLSELKIVYLVGVPVLTMRSFAEERRSHTDQLLYALPLSSGSIVVGKHLAMLAVLSVPLVAARLVPPVPATFGDVYLPTAYLAIGAFFLMGAARGDGASALPRRSRTPFPARTWRRFSRHAPLKRTASRP